VIYRYELKKLATSPAVLAFIVLCIVANFFVCLSASFGEVNLENTPLPSNVFETFDALSVSEKYIESENADGLIADMYLNKYADLQTIADNKAERGDSLSVYFGVYTHYLHQDLFGKLMMWILLEGMILAMLLSILSIGWEQIHKTELLINSTKIGRKLMLRKIGASLTAGLCSFVIIAAVTLGVYFIINDFSGVWSANVSSGYNYIKDRIAGDRPFTTWHNFSVIGFLFAHLGISAGLVACASLMGSAAGLLAKNSYVGFFGAVIINVICAVIPSIITSAVFVKYLFILTPANLSVRTGFWFTDGLVDVMFKNFETLGLCLSLGVTLCVLFAAMTGFKRRDLA
jgi:hypothetical protein